MESSFRLLATRTAIAAIIACARASGVSVTESWRRGRTSHPVPRTTVRVLGCDARASRKISYLRRSRRQQALSNAAQQRLDLTQDVERAHDAELRGAVAAVGPD
jgi:hypothetical protein